MLPLLLEDACLTFDHFVPAAKRVHLPETVGKMAQGNCIRFGVGDAQNSDFLSMEFVHSVPTHSKDSKCDYSLDKETCSYIIRER